MHLLVHIELFEEDLGNWLVASGGKVTRSEVATAQMDGRRHVGGLVAEGGVDELHILLGQLLDVFSPLDRALAHLFGAEVFQNRSNKSR